MLHIVQVPVLQDNYVYLVHEPVSEQTAVIDPALADPVLEAAGEQGWTISHILNTHHHGDHVNGNLAIQKATGCEIIGNKHDRSRLPGQTTGVEEGDMFYLGQVPVHVIEVSGHTVGHIAYYIPSDHALFCGDTLFSMGCGRLFEGSPGQMWESLTKLISLPEETLIYCAHEYTEANARFAVTVDPENPDLKARVADVQNMRARQQPTIPVSLGIELKTNPFLRAGDPALAARMEKAVGAETFAEIRHRKDVF